MSHTPEPWITVPENAMPAGTWNIGTEQDSGSIGITYPGTLGVDAAKSNAARIVACVNGCAGLNPAAYRQVVEALQAILDCGSLKKAEQLAQAALAAARQE